MNWQRATACTCRESSRCAVRWSVIEPKLRNAQIPEVLYTAHHRRPRRRRGCAQACRPGRPRARRHARQRIGLPALLPGVSAAGLWRSARSSRIGAAWPKGSGPPVQPVAPGSRWPAAAAATTGRDRGGYVSRCRAWRRLRARSTGPCAPSPPDASADRPVRRSLQPATTCHSPDTDRVLFAVVVKRLAEFCSRLASAGQEPVLWRRGRMVVSGPGVAGPKSWRSGCELAALESEPFPGCPPRRAGLRPACPARGSRWRARQGTCCWVRTRR